MAIITVNNPNLPNQGAQIQVPFSGDYRIDVLIDGPSYRWNAPAPFGTPTVVTYSFMSAMPTYGSGTDGSDFVAFTPTQQALVRDFFSYISSFTQLTFQEVPDSAANYGQIRFGNSTQEQTAGYAFFPNTFGNQNVPYKDLSGDVWIGTDYMRDTQPGSWGYTTLLHEIGHALGLDHPGDYNAGGGVDPESIRNFLGEAEDLTAYTIMSYGDVPQLLGRTDFGMFDILALQFIYGARPANAGDTVHYLENSDGLRQHMILDSGGVDTLDLSHLSMGGVIDLRSGQFSSVGITPYGQAANYNVSIAIGTVIENLVGSNLADILSGNGFNNRITGGGGNDLIDGAGGIDTAVFSGARSQYTVEMTLSGKEPKSVADSVYGRDGTDSFTGIERLAFADRSLAFDLNGHAGQAARLLTVLVGPEALGNYGLVGAVLNLLDAGVSAEQVAGMGLDLLFGSQRSAGNTAQWLATNATGTASQGTVSDWTGKIAGGGMSDAALAVYASGLDTVGARIDLVGLQHSGLSYIG